MLAAAERPIHGTASVEAAAPGPLLVPSGTDFELRSLVLDERPPLRRRQRTAA